MINTNLPRNCVVFLFGLVDVVKGKRCNYKACLRGSLYSTLNHLSITITCIL